MVRMVLAFFVTLPILIPGSAPAEERGVPGVGIVYVVGGVGGMDPLSTWAQTAFQQAQVPHEVRLFFWTHGKGRVLRDLQDTTHLVSKAEELAGEIREELASTDRPIYLVGHSAGAGVVLEAAARLPPATLARIVLLSAAVSPGYDLRPALRATRGEIISFHSSLDRVWLGWGTRQFGTVDRVYGPSAGMLGFQQPGRSDPEGRQLYRRLVQVAWTPRMLLAFCGGSHHSTVMPLFLATQVAPWLLPCSPCRPWPCLEETPCMR
jgi:pimeloyl-ACP methyl ester carboxylesterase